MRNQSRICTSCTFFTRGPTHTTCSGVIDLVTGRTMNLAVRTARLDNKYCGPSGKCFEAAELPVPEVTIPSTIVDITPRKKTPLKITHKQKERV